MSHLPSGLNVCICAAGGTSSQWRISTCRMDSSIPFCIPGRSIKTLIYHLSWHHYQGSCPILPMALSSNPAMRQKVFQLSEMMMTNSSMILPTSVLYWERKKVWKPPPRRRKRSHINTGPAEEKEAIGITGPKCSPGPSIRREGGIHIMGSNVLSLHNRDTTACSTKRSFQSGM